MYLPSCYVFARWACVSLHVSEGLLSLASGQSGFPALRRQEQSETGNSAGCCHGLRGRKVSGWACTSHYHHSLRTESRQELNLPNCPFMFSVLTKLNLSTQHQWYSLSLKCFEYGVAEPALTDAVAVPDIHTLSVRVSHGNGAQPFQQPEMGAAVSRPCLEIIHFMFWYIESIVGSQPRSDKPHDIKQQNWDNHFTFFII